MKMCSFPRSAILLAAKTFKRSFFRTLEMAEFAVGVVIASLVLYLFRPRYHSNSGRLLIIPEFDQFGGTRTYFKTLIPFFGEQGWGSFVALEKRQVDAEIINLCRTYDAKLIVIPRRPRWLMGRRHRLFFNILYDIYSIVGVFIKTKPALIVVSNGTPGDYCGLFLLPCRIMYIMHTSPTSKPDRLLDYLINSSLSPWKVIMTVSDYSKESILKYWIHKGEKKSYVRFVHNATNIKKMATPLRNNDQSVQSILTIGHLVEYKNPLQWVRIAEEVIQRSPAGCVKFLWLGSGPLYEECIRTIEISKTTSIRFIGFSTNPYPYLANCDIYFQPSLRESHGLAVVEAMAFGKPCIVSNCGGLPESVVDGCNGYVVDLNDETSIIEKLLYLLGDQERLQRMGEQSMNLFYARFSIPVWTKKMKSELERIFAKNTMLPRG